MKTVDDILIQPKGPPTGFSKGINDQLIPAATLVHLKAAGLLGFALTLTGFLLSRTPAGELAQGLHLAGLLLVLGSAMCAGAGIYPVKRRSQGGRVFWGDIAAHKSAATYAESLASLDPQRVEREYAFANYNLSRVLDKKFGLIRGAVCLLLLGSSLAASAWLVG